MTMSTNPPDCYVAYSDSTTTGATLWSPAVLDGSEPVLMDEHGVMTAVVRAVDSDYFGGDPFTVRVFPDRDRALLANGLPPVGAVRTASSS